MVIEAYFVEELCDIVHCCSASSDKTENCDWPRKPVPFPLIRRYTESLVV